MVKKLINNEQTADKKYMTIGSKTYTRRELSDEILNETQLGIDFITNMLMLAIDLTARQKV